jgi:ABC-type phosphate transport system substrate-binding protein
MNMIRLQVCLVCAAWLVGAGPAAALDGGVVVANPSVPGSKLSAVALKDIYTGRTTYWPDGQPVIIIVLAGDDDTALKSASGMDASQFRTYWQRLVFSGRGQQPKKADDAVTLLALVAATKGAIALMPTDAIYAGIKKLEVK